MEFYELQRRGLGGEFAVEVGVAITVLDAPKRWPEVDTGIRKYRIDRFPYGIFYRLQDAANVEIIAIFDLRRRPDAWERR